MLLEIMVALAIVSLSLVMALETFNLSRKAERNSRDLDLGVLFAKRIVSKTRIYGYPDEGILRGYFKEPYSRFGYQSQISSTEVDNLREARVTIFKDEKPLFATTTYVAKRSKI